MHQVREGERLAGYEMILFEKFRYKKSVAKSQQHLAVEFVMLSETHCRIFSYILTLAASSSGIVSACHRGDWSYGS
jgi:hypothetical protein